MNPTRTLGGLKEKKPVDKVNSSSLTDKPKLGSPDHEPTSKFVKGLIYIVFVVVFTAMVDFVYFGSTNPERYNMFSWDRDNIFKSYFYYFFMFPALIVFGISWVKKEETIKSLKAAGIKALYITPLVAALSFFVPVTIPDIKSAWAEKRTQDAIALQKKIEAEEARKLEKERRKKQASRYITDGRTFIFTVHPNDKDPYKIEIKLKKNQRFAFLTYNAPIEFRVKDDPSSCFEDVRGNTPLYAYVEGPLEVRATGNVPADVTVIIEDKKNI